jgi:SAM-dependent methyltransferase
VPARALQDLYENPTTPLAVGVEPARVQAEVIARRLLTHRRHRATAVDIGCGDGATGIAAVQACAESNIDLALVGIDWSVAGLTKARQLGVAVARGSVESPGFPLAGGSVDVVIMSEIIEHVVDTDVLLIEAFRVLKGGGLLVCSTPNLAAWYNRVLLAAGVQPVFSEVSLQGIYGRPGNEVVGHLRLFTKRALVQLLEANDYVDVAVSGMPYHDVPRGFKAIDRALCRFPGLSSLLLGIATKP